MKKKVIAAILSIASFIGVFSPVYSEKVWDNASGWAEQELEKAQSRDLIPEIIYGKDFSQKTTREEFCEIAVLLYDSFSDKEAEELPSPFSDTSNPNVLRAYSLGIVNGISDTEFGPDLFLTREQAAAMLGRVYSAAFSQEISFSENGEKFSDDSLISPWAKNAVYFMAEYGIIKGVDGGNFAPRYITEEDELSGYGSATREQAVIIALRMNETFLTEVAGDGGQPPEVTAEQDKLKKGEDVFTIGFIGGSLTQSGGTWINAVKQYFQEKYPDKTVQTVNAGNGGTTSQMGAVRYRKDIMEYDPDLVFVEFSVNDYYLDELNSKAYMESIVRQSFSLSKLPYMIFLHAPEACDKNTDLYMKWQRGVQWKDQIAAAYGIKTINIYDYMYDIDYAKMRSEDPSVKSFTDYLAKFYQKAGNEFNVHGGYVKYAEAIIRELDNDFEGCLTKPKKTSSKTDTNITDARYRVIYATDSNIHYTKDHWTLYSAGNLEKNPPSGHGIAESMLAFPRFPSGVYQTTSSGAKFGYFTSKGTKEICLSYVSSTAGMSLSVLVDDVFVKSVTSKSPYQNVNYLTDWIPIPDDGKRHRVVFVTDDSGTVFRYGAIFEKYMPQ